MKRKLPSLLVFQPVCSYSTSPRAIPFSSSFFKKKGFFLDVWWITHFQKEFIFPPTYVLHPVQRLNTFPLCLTAAAGTEFARDSVFHFLRKRKTNKRFDILPSLEKLEFFPSITSTEMLDQAFAHCQRFFTAAAKNADGPFFSSIVAILPKRKAMDHWLGTL